MPVVMGLDPGSHHTGVGVVHWNPKNPDQLQVLFCEVLNLTSGNLSERLGDLSAQLENCFEKFRPDFVAVESAFLGKNVASAFTLGQARGVCLALVGKYRAQFAEYAPRSIKKRITGNGAADKVQVQTFLQKIYGVHQSSLDACDALAVAICHAQELQLQQRLIGMEAL